MNRIVSYASTDTFRRYYDPDNDIAAAVLRQYPMSRYARLLDEDFDTTADEPSSSSTTLSPPPSSAFFLNGTNSNSINNNRSSNIHNTNTNNTQRMSNMLASLKESAANASGSLRENMGKASNSVRSGLGLPSGSADNNNIINNADESDAMTEASGTSSSSQVLEEISEYCPKLTYQQVRKELMKCK